MSEQTVTHTAIRYTWLEPKETQWTAACFAKLRKAWADPGILRKDLAQHVGRTEAACCRMARLLGLGRRPTAAHAKATHEWSAAEVAVLREDWPDIARIADRTGRTPYAVERKARNVGLPPKTHVEKGAAPRAPRTVKAEERLAVRAERQPKIARRCLCCGTAFEAPTRFIRMCNPCKGLRA